MQTEFHKTKLIQCPCNNNIVVYGHTERESKSPYGFKSIIEVSGIANLDHFSNVLCVCGKVHNIKRFTTIFHNQAKKHFSENLPTIEQELTSALCNLLEWAKGNRGSKAANPYMVPEVVDALKLLAKIQGVENYLDAKTNE